MSLLRSDSGDGSINFQKASCTLDGCVKVWTSRVDSVVVETGKLLSGLQDEAARPGTSKGRGAGAGESEDEGFEDGEDEDGEGAGAGKRRKRNAASREATLAKSFAPLRIRKFDLEFTVDPLFKKTSADFDEGGAGGLLMNHLSVDSQARVVFDAGDVAGVADEADGAEVDGEGEGAAVADKESSTESQKEAVDLTRLRAKLFQSPPAISAGGASAMADVAALLDGKALCPSLASFRFAPDDNTPFGAAPGEDERSSADAAWADPGVGLGLGDAGEEVSPLDGFGGDGADFFGDDGASDGGDAGETFDFSGAEGGPSASGEGDADADPTSGTLAPFDPRQHPAERDLVMAMQGAQAEAGEDGAGAMFDYFDQRMLKNWAGPEHWKMRRIIAKKGKFFLRSYQ